MVVLLQNALFAEAAMGGPVVFVCMLRTLSLQRRCAHSGPISAQKLPTVDNHAQIDLKRQINLKWQINLKCQINLDWLTIQLDSVPRLALTLAKQLL